MGSKGVLLSGIALVIGVYAVGIKKADNLVAGSALTHAYKIQSENDARMGVRAGIHWLRGEPDGSSSGLSYTNSFIFNSDTVLYIVSIPAFVTSGQITSTSNFKGWQTVIKANVKLKFAGASYYWQPTAWYIVPNPNEAKYVYQ